MSFYDRILNCRPPPAKSYRPFLVEETVVGYITDVFTGALAEFKDVFAVSGEEVRLSDGLGTHADRTEAVDRVLRILAERGLVPNWRDEAYPVGIAFGAPSFFHMERAAVPLFGVLAFGVHVNGYTGQDPETRMWVGKRALDKPIAPGELDQIVAGGQPAGLSLMENVIKESAEEADIPADLAAKAIPVSTVTYCMVRPEGLRRDVLFNYDLHLPEDFEPVNTDGEAEGFYLWPIEKVMQTVNDTDEFKFNCAMVAIDFLIRHGHIQPDHPDYVDLVSGLRAPTSLGRS